MLADFFSSSYTLPVLTGFLSVVHELKDNVQLVIKDSLNFICVYTLGILIGMYKYRIITVKRILLPPSCEK